MENTTGIIPSPICIASSVLSEEDDTESEDELDKRSENKKRRKCWVKPISETRKTDGEFVTLFHTLENNEVEFKNYFNMSLEKFNELIEIIAPHIKKKNTTFRSAISPKERLAVCLRYLATGTSFKKIAADYRLGHSTVHQIINETCKGIWTALSTIVMPKPTDETWQNIETGFRTKWMFPNCLGCLGGKQIIIHTPKQYNEKIISIVLLALIDHNSKFVIVDVGDFDKISTRGIFSNSMLGKLLSSDILKLPVDKPFPDMDNLMPHVFIGNEGFPLKKNVMRPYTKKNAEIDADKKIFNNRLNNARKVSDVVFRMLIHNYKFYQNKIQMKPDNVENVILATCCLHNFLLDELESIPDNYIKDGVTVSVKNLPLAGGNSMLEAISIRDEFKTYFSSQTADIEQII